MRVPRGNDNKNLALFWQNKRRERQARICDDCLPNRAASRVRGPSFNTLGRLVFALGSAPGSIVDLAHDPLHPLLKTLPSLGRGRLDEPRAVPDGVEVEPLRDLSRRHTKGGVTLGKKRYGVSSNVLLVATGCIW